MEISPQKGIAVSIKERAYYLTKLKYNPFKGKKPLERFVYVFLTSAYPERNAEVAKFGKLKGGDFDPK